MIDKLKKLLSNLCRYLALNIRPQVDIEVMTPIFEKHFSRMGSYTEDHHLRVYKINADKLHFGLSNLPYAPQSKWSYVYGTIGTRIPKDRLNNWLPSDLNETPYMIVHSLAAFTEEGIIEMNQALEDIAQETGIERIIKAFEFDLKSGNFLVNVNCIPPRCIPSRTSLI